MMGTGAPSDDGRAAASTAKPRRLVLVDGLRGYAALAVLLMHLGMFLGIDGMLHWGRLGVPVFFVISGCVIAVSLGDQPITARFAGNYVARRMVRLDPPYYVSLVLCLALAWLVPRIHPSASYEAGDTKVSTVMANMTYTHNLLRLPQISDVAWTLCLEVEFYLTLLALWALLGNARQAWRPPVVLALGLVGLATYQYPNPDAPGLFFNSFRSLVPHLGMFALGILAFLAMTDRCSPVWFHAMAAATAVRLLVEWEPYTAAALVTAVLIYLASRCGIMSWLLGDPVSQWLGQRSYSIYLYHFPVGWLIVKVLGQLLPSGPFKVPLQFAAAVVGALLVSHALHLGVERPSMACCDWLKRRSA